MGLLQQYEPISEKLKRLYASDAAFKAVSDDFASREKNSWFSTVERVCQRTGLVRGEVVRCFKLLQELDSTPAGRIGEFIVGRRGQQSRFEWSKSSLSVGRVAAGEPSDIEERPADDGEEVESDDGALVEHRYRLRADLEIKFELPPDLSQREAERLADFVKTLPLQ